MAVAKPFILPTKARERGNPNGVFMYARALSLGQTGPRGEANRISHASYTPAMASCLSAL